MRSSVCIIDGRQSEHSQDDVALGACLRPCRCSVGSGPGSDWLADGSTEGGMC